MGRNVVRGPDFVNLDFSVIKTFTLRERLNMELRGEFFNGLNRPNLPGQAEIFYNWFYETPRRQEKPCRAIPQWRKPGTPQTLRPPIRS
jgi:hypothetical protein